MCTVLQQHLQDRKDFEEIGRKISPPVQYSSNAPTYSYLADNGSLRRPIDPYDRKVSTPNIHFHVPPEGSRRSRASYLRQLYGRSRSHSRTGMRLLVDSIRNSTPRPRSPHMNNEEPIGLAHFPDGRHPEQDKLCPIERDDFPAPPFAYSDPRRRRHWSEPGLKGSEDDEDARSSVSSHSEEEEFVDEQLDKSEKELKKISTGMGRVFLTEIAIERERRKSAKRRYIDPRSAARSPAANKEPCFRLRYDSPINASPSRIADHSRPWDDDGRRSCATPFLTGYPTPSPAPTKVKSSTLPPRFSPAGGYDSSVAGSAVKMDSTADFSSKSDLSSGDVNFGERPRSGCSVGPHTANGITLKAPNIYPLHLLFTSNYRLPGDVDRKNLEKHLSDTEFHLVFECSRLDFYQMPYWKRCELKRKYYLF